MRLRLVEEKRGHARAELLEVLQPSPDRISPPCRHFGKCGGCHYQHIAYERQLEMKTAILRDQLERIGKLSAPPVDPCVPSPVIYNYRNHLQLQLTPDGQLGFYQVDGRQILAIEECLLPEAPIVEVWPQLSFEALPELERIALRLGENDDLQVVLESADPQPPEISVEDLPVSVVHLSPAGSLVLAGSEAVFIEVLGRPFRVSAGSFFQMNTAMAAAMVEHLLSHTVFRKNMTVLDAYCGVGLFSAFIAPHVGQLIGIEASPSACEDFAINLDEFENVAIYEAPVEEALPNLSLKPDLIVIDPPRPGIDRKAMDSILAQSAAQLVYISCDPATLASDARRLADGGYRLSKVTPFDLFPQTYQIESISFWER